MRLVIHNDVDELVEWTAEYILKRINAFQPNENKYFVMGLATGRAPLAIYKKLIEYYRAGKVSFKYVKTINPIDFIGLPENHAASYHAYTRNNFTNHVDIDPENVYMLNGNAKDLVAECENYERKIKEAGGIELLLAGIGYDGHVAFDEPGSSLVSRTRVKTLAPTTLEEFSMFFENDVNKVPKQVLTIGIATMLESVEPVFVLNGAGKAIALQKIIEEGVNHIWTASAFQQHARTLIICDEDATLELRVRTARHFKNLWNIHSKLIENTSS